MDSSASRTAQLKQPLLEDIAIEAPSTKNDLDVEHHVSSLITTSRTEVTRQASGVSPICSEGFIMWVVLPTLLFSQFGMAFLMHDERTTTMSWTVVNLSIVLFVITSWLFRHACNDANVKTVVFLLLPEISMDIVLGLVLFNRVALGFMVLLISMLCLSSFVVISTALFLYVGESSEEESKEQCNKEEEPQKLAVCQIV